MQTTEIKKLSPDAAIIEKITNAKWRLRATNDFKESPAWEYVLPVPPDDNFASVNVFTTQALAVRAGKKLGRPLVLLAETPEGLQNC